MLHLRGANHWRNTKHRQVEIFVCRCRLSEKHLREMFLVFKKIFLNLGFHLKIFHLRVDLLLDGRALSLVPLNCPQHLAKQGLSTYFSTQRLKAKVCMEESIGSWPQCLPVGHHSRSSSKKDGEFALLFLETKELSDHLCASAGVSQVLFSSQWCHLNGLVFLVLLWTLWYPPAFL